MTWHHFPKYQSFLHLMVSSIPCIIACAHYVATVVSPVVYDNSLTDAFFTCLVYLHSIICQPPTTLISLEKR